MIKHFGSLYAGHGDLGDLRLAAAPVNERRFDNEQKYPGLEYMPVGCNRMGAPPEVMLERFAEGVMPHFAVAERDGG